MKTAKELNALKEEVRTLSRKLHELSNEELKQITGGEFYLCPGRENCTRDPATCYIAEEGFCGQ